MMRVTVLKAPKAGGVSAIVRYLDPGTPERSGPGGYYTETPDPPGRWWGAGCDAVGLAGEVEPEQLERMLEAQHPLDGRRLGRGFGESSARAYDTTFSAPKSVSLLWALSPDENVRAEVVAAHDAAVEATLGWLEQHGGVTRRGKDGVHQVDARGLTVALFRQHTSRMLDPQLHTHAVIWSKVQDSTGAWLALDARFLLKQQYTMSWLYDAALRVELTRRLGLDWEPLVPGQGQADLTAVPEALRDLFSQRSVQVEAKLAELVRRWMAEHDDARADRRGPLAAHPACRRHLPAGQGRRAGRPARRLARARRRRRLRCRRPRHRRAASRLARPRRSGHGDRHGAGAGGRTGIVVDRGGPGARDRRPAPPGSVGDAGELLALVDALAAEAPVAASSCTHRPRPAPPCVGMVGRSPSTSPAARSPPMPCSPRRHACSAGPTPPSTQLRPSIRPSGSRPSPTPSPAPVSSCSSSAPPERARPPPSPPVSSNSGISGGPSSGWHRRARPPTYSPKRPVRRPPRSPSCCTPTAPAARLPPRGTTLSLDEAGMASTEDLDHLVALSQRRDWRLVAVGDPEQLPSVTRAACSPTGPTPSPPTASSTSTASTSHGRPTPRSRSVAATRTLPSPTPSTSGSAACTQPWSPDQVARTHAAVTARGETLAITTSSQAMARAINEEIQWMARSGKPEGHTVDLPSDSRTAPMPASATRWPPAATSRWRPIGASPSATATPGPSPPPRRIRSGK